ncbi:hypothetical protein SH501x_002295 [Pirellulaceae bacterium SH501]
MTLPTERDFDPFQGDLDAQCAWRNFGGLTLAEACAKFEENPECYQEDFMFMGGKAFAFYYPAIDQFLRKSVCIPEDQRGDRQSWILPQCIKNQFEGNGRRYLLDLKDSVLELCRFMIENIHIFEQDWEDLTEIERHWRDLDQFLRRTH